MDGWRDSRVDSADTAGSLGSWPVHRVHDTLTDARRAPGALFPDASSGIVFEQVDSDNVNIGELHTTEFPFVARAVERRQQEFAAGRVCARRALARLGIPTVALPVRPDRQPMWPDGVIGSIAHTMGYCGAAVATRASVAGIGFDVEPASALPDEVWQSVLTDEERRRLAVRSEPDRGIHARLLFSLKEAFYKCCQTAGGGWLDFHDIEIHLDPTSGDAPSHVYARKRIWDGTPPLSGRYAITSHYIFTSFTMLHSVSAPANSGSS